VQVTALNERGQVLGDDCDTTVGRCELFLWTESQGRKIILSYSTSGGFVQKALLNDSGHVVAQWSLWPVSVASRVDFWSDATGWQVVPQLMNVVLFSNRDEMIGTTPTGVQALLNPRGAVYPIIDPLGRRLGVYAMNDHGLAAGALYPADMQVMHPMVWTESDGTMDLGIPSGLGVTTGYAYRANNLGEVAARLEDPYTFRHHLFVWRRQSGIEDVGECIACSPPLGFNDHGEMAGWTYTAAMNTIRGYYWSKATGFRDIGTLGGSYAVIAAMNDRGQVVGQSDTATGMYHGFVWSLKDGMTDLTPAEYASPRSINHDGTILGWTNEGPCVWRLTHGQ
jgi:probable HAF family extracellular repeat protein